MEGYKSKIGKEQMRQYMGGMYANSLVVYREYLANACDAVEQALRKGLIPNRRQANIAVTIDQYNRSISIHDVGIGISQKNIGPYLVDVASSQKYKQNLVGRFGIGRLNGAKFCDRIVYETSFAGEPIKSTLIWDVADARRICDDDSIDVSADQIIDLVTHRQPEQSEDVNAHYCKVTLENVNDKLLMDEDAVRDYISEIVSVDYSLEFKDNALGQVLDLPQNDGYAKRFEDLWVYEVSVNSVPVKKKYRSEFEDKHIGTIQCFSLKDEKTQEELAWGWYALNRTAKQIHDLPFSFIRARHNNFQIGESDYLNKYHKTTTAASYCIGELHITHPQINPTGSRDGIESSADFRHLEVALKKFLTKVYKIYDKASHFRSDIIEDIAKLDVEIARQKLIAKTESDPEEITKIRKKIREKQDEKKSKLALLKPYQDFFEDQGVWDIAENIVDSVNESVINVYNTRANVQKADAQIPELKIDDFKPSTPKPTKPGTPQSQPGGGDIPSKPNTPGGENNPGENPGNVPGNNPDAPVDPSVPNEMDDYKSLSTVERALVRKFLSVINSMTELPEKQKAKMKSRLRKKIIK